MDCLACVFFAAEGREADALFPLLDDDFLVCAISFPFASKRGDLDILYYCTIFYYRMQVFHVTLGE